jgi:2'-5' RNA ligase
MRYFIGCNIRGEAAEYYKATCADLAARFGVEDVSTIVPPHITVKTAFERASVETIDEVIALMAAAPAHPVSLSGWNHFGTRTIFIDAPAMPPELKSFVVDILGKFKSTGITISPQDQAFQLRLSVARFLKPKQFEEIWRHIQSMPAPKFDLSFDNLTIFVKENRDDRAWKILKTFPLMGKR